MKVRQYSENLQYRNDPKFSEIQLWANNVYPDQTAPEQLLLKEQSYLGPH